MVMPLVLLLNLCKLQCLVSKWGDTMPPLLVGGLRGNSSQELERGHGASMLAGMVRWRGQYSYSLVHWGCPCQPATGKLHGGTLMT